MFIIGLTKLLIGSRALTLIKAHYLAKVLGKLQGLSTKVRWAYRMSLRVLVGCKRVIDYAVKVRGRSCHNLSYKLVNISRLRLIPLLKVALL